MEVSISKQEVREINRKLFAYDIIYEDDSKFEDENEREKNKTFTTILSDIIQSYDPEDALANVPTILEIKERNITTDTLDKILLLNKNSVYIQINNNIMVNPDKLAIIRDLKEYGYKIVIEINESDKVFTLASVLADILKIDIHRLPKALFNNNINNKASQCKILAYNVDSAEDYALAESTNIDLYEGSYVSPYTELKIEAQGHSNLNFVQIMSVITRDIIDITELAELIERDSLMSAQVIRLANSAYFENNARVESIEDAIVSIGINNLKRWIFLMEFSRNDNAPEEVLRTTYQRAIMCKKIAEKLKRIDLRPNDAYFIGLFSTLDILTGKLLVRELSTLNITDVVKNSLIYREGVGGTLLNLVKAYEEADFTHVDRYCETLRISREDVYNIYYDSIGKASKLWKDTTELGGVY